MTVPLYNLTDTWNNGATTFTGIGFNVTDTASATTSNFINIQANGVPIMQLAKNTTGGLGTGLILIAETPNGQTIEITPRGPAGVAAFTLGGGYTFDGSVGIYNNTSFQLGATSIAAGADTFLYRDAALTLALRSNVSGANANAFRVYNTADAFPTTTNYERGVFDWTTTANTLTIGTQAAGTGTLRGMTLVFGNLTFGTTVANMLTFNYFGTNMVSMQNGNTNGAATVTLGWSSTGDSTASADTCLARQAAGVIQLGNAAGQTNITKGSTFSAISNSPATLASGSTNNYNPTGTSYFQRLTANAANSTLTGISIGGSALQVDGEIHTIINVAAAGTLTLSHQDAGSTAGNRFLCSTGASIVLSPNQAADLIYDGTASRWLVFKRN